MALDGQARIRVTRKVLDEAGISRDDIDALRQGGSGVGGSGLAEPEAKESTEQVPAHRPSLKLTPDRGPGDPPLAPARAAPRKGESPAPPSRDAGLSPQRKRPGKRAAAPTPSLSPALGQSYSVRVKLSRRGMTPRMGSHAQGEDHLHPGTVLGLGGGHRGAGARGDERGEAQLLARDPRGAPAPGREGCARPLASWAYRWRCSRTFKGRRSGWASSRAASWRSARARRWWSPRATCWAMTASFPHRSARCPRTWRRATPSCWTTAGCGLRVEKVQGRDVTCTVELGGTLKDHKGLNLPGGARVGAHHHREGRGGPGAGPGAGRGLRGAVLRALGGGHPAGARARGRTRHAPHREDREAPGGGGAGVHRARGRTASWWREGTWAWRCHWRSCRASRSTWCIR